MDLHASAKVGSTAAPLQLPAKPADSNASSTVCLHNAKQKTTSAELSKTLTDAPVNLSASRNNAAATLASQHMAADTNIKQAISPGRSRANASSDVSQAMQWRADQKRSHQSRNRAPDRTKAENAARSAAKAIENRVLEQAKNEIDQINLKDKNSSSLLFRGNSEGAKKIGALLKGAFKDDVKNITDAMDKTFASTIQQCGPNPSDKDVENAVIATYQALLESLKDIEFSPAFERIAKNLSKFVDDAADMQSKKATSEEKKSIATNADACKKNIVSAMLLRSLCADLTLSLNSKKSDIFNSTMKNRSKTGHPIQFHQFASALISKINLAQFDHKNTSLKESFSGFETFLKSDKNNLDSFKALHKLNQATSSPSSPASTPPQPMPQTPSLQANLAGRT